MSEDRETKQAGSPIEESAATDTEVLAAVERARDAEDPADLAKPAADDEKPIVLPKAPADDAADESDDAPEPGQGDSALVLPAAPEKDGAATRSARDGETGSSTDASEETAALSVAETEALLGEPRDGEIRVSADHPMAALYMQTPMPPELRGNRGAGVLIALLATVAFAVLYAGVHALLIAADYPPSTFFEEGLLPRLLSLEFWVTVAGFFVAAAVLALLLGKAGWWAYVLGGFFVGAAVWAFHVLGAALQAHFVDGEAVTWTAAGLLADYGFTLLGLGAAVIARELALWFGVWTGVRGRKIAQLNAEAVTDYEEALAEVRAKQ